LAGLSRPVLRIESRPIRCVNGYARLQQDVQESFAVETPKNIGRPSKCSIFAGKPIAVLGLLCIFCIRNSSECASFENERKLCRQTKEQHGQDSSELPDQSISAFRNPALVLMTEPTLE
jgi:hypothetical protein